MSTGYTCCVEDGSVTSFKIFARRCAKAFGACYHQRDDALNDKLSLPTLDEYHKHRAEEARNELAEAEAWTFAQKLAARDEYCARQRQQRDESLARNKVVEKRYKKMLQKVEMWEPPTPDHVNMKNFMLEQLQDSLKFDIHHLDDDIIVPSVDEYYKDVIIDGLKRNITYHDERWAQALRSNAEKCKWLVDLQNSLEKCDD